MDFYSFFWQLKQVGVGDVFIPFILIFTLIYAILQTTHILGKDSKRFNVIVAMSLAFLVVLPHVTGDYPKGSDVVVIMNNAIPGVVGFIVAVIMFFILVGAFGGAQPDVSNLGGLFVILSIIVIIVIFGRAAGWFGTGSSASISPYLNFLNDPNVATFIVIILVFGVVLWIIVREPKKPSSSKLGEKMDNFLKWFAKK